MIRRFVVLVGLLSCFTLAAGESIKVGVYDFPPFAFVDDTVSGVSTEMIGLMNDFQQQYQFEIVATTAKRRYQDFEQNKFDMLIFESKSWGWLNQPVDATQAFLKGKELYVAKAESGRDQHYFTDFNNKIMVGVLGFHYGFARFHAEQDYLEKHFKILLTENQGQSLELILKGRGEIAVIPKAYINYYLKQHPSHKAKLLIADKYDQIYRHTALVRQKTTGFDVKHMNRLLMAMKQQGVLTPLWKKYGL